MNDDVQHLSILSVFHYVCGGITALCACVPVVHLVIGLTMLFAPEKFNDPSGKGIPPEVASLMGLLFTVLPVVAIGLGWTMAICLVAAGRFLKQQRHYMFCLVIAGVSCMAFPFGTVLGVFTIIVLMRPSVKQLFGVAEGSATPFAK
jgi:hypothetical protein